MTRRIVFLLSIAVATLSGRVTLADVVIDSIASRFVNTAATYDSMPGSASNTTPGPFIADESGFGSGPGGSVSTNAKQTSTTPAVTGLSISGVGDVAADVSWSNSEEHGGWSPLADS